MKGLKKEKEKKQANPALIPVTLKKKNHNKGRKYFKDKHYLSEPRPATLPAPNTATCHSPDLENWKARVSLKVRIAMGEGCSLTRLHYHTAHAML